MNKDFKKAEKMVANIKKARVDALVRARKGELWIKDHQHTYNELMADYLNIKDTVIAMIEFRKSPIWANVIVQSMAFFKNPVGHILHRGRGMKRTLDSYWRMKAIKKEWDDDFEFTNKRIDEDYEFVEGSEKHIKKIEELINRWRNKLTKIKKLKRKYK